MPSPAVVALVVLSTAVLFVIFFVAVERLCRSLAGPLRRHLAALRARFSRCRVCGTPESVCRVVREDVGQRCCGYCRTGPTHTASLI